MRHLLLSESYHVDDDVHACRGDSERGWDRRLGLGRDRSRGSRLGRKVKTEAEDEAQVETRKFRIKRAGSPRCGDRCLNRVRRRRWSCRIRGGTLPDRLGRKVDPGQVRNRKGGGRGG